jgi:hypothetical protein
MTPIKAADDLGNIVYSFPSIREAGRAGFSLSRIHKAIYTRQRHKGLNWFLSGGLVVLPIFISNTFDLTAPAWTDDAEIFAAFRASLSPDEVLRDDEWGWMDFEGHLAAAVRPNIYARSGKVQGAWKGERQGVVAASRKGSGRVPSLDRVAGDPPGA